MGSPARLGCVAAWLLLGAAAWTDGADLQTRITRHLETAQNPEAARLIEEFLDRFPGDAVMLYNAACVQCRLGEIDRGAAYLIEAVKAGFVDISHLRRDPDLRPLRDHPVFQAIVAARQAADAQLARTRLREWRKRLGPRDYRYETDEQLGIGFATALGDEARRNLRRMLARQARILGERFFDAPPGTDAAARSRVIVVVPTADDARRYLREPNAGGVYLHRRRELIALDPGRSMRHEFVHALHHRHMDDVGQEHPPWIQEGLASLFEAYVEEAPGAIRFPPNDRHGLVLMNMARLFAWRDLAAMPAGRLREEAARSYPQLRSMFRFLAEQGLLEPWYRAYVEGFDEDPSGVSALELISARRLEELQEQWRQWLDGQD